MTLQFHGQIDGNGQLVLNDPRAFKRFAKTLSGERVTVTLTKAKSKRSLDQNAWIWGVAYPLIAEHCGNDHHEHEQLHYDLLSVRYGTVAIAPMVPGAQPRIVPAKTTSSMTTTEFSEYMEWLARFAAEKLDVVIPLPDDANTGLAAVQESYR